MALVALCSAKGSPGTTTSALALAAMWPRAVVLADCDPAGGDVALRLPGPDGAPLDADRGLLSLAAVARRGLQPDDLATHLQQVVGGLDVLVGLGSAEQAAGLDPVWPVLGSMLARLPGTDVLVDVGRIGPGAATLALLRSAALVVVVARPEVASLFHARERLGALGSSLRSASIDHVRTAVLLVSDPSDQRGAQGARAAFAQAEHPPDHVWELALDPRGAGIFAGRSVPRPERTGLVRSATTTAAAVLAAVGGA